MKKKIFKILLNFGVFSACVCGFGTASKGEQHLGDMSTLEFTLMGQRHVGAETVITIKPLQADRMRIEFEFPAIPLPTSGEDVLEKIISALKEREFARTMKVIEAMGCMEAICLPQDLVTQQLDQRLLKELIAQKCALAICIDQKGIFEITLEELIGVTKPHQIILNKIECKDSICLPKDLEDRVIFGIRPTDIIDPSCWNAICIDENNGDPAVDDEIPTPALKEQRDEADKAAREAAKKAEEAERKRIAAERRLEEARQRNADEAELKTLKEELATADNESNEARAAKEAAEAESIELHRQYNRRSDKAHDGQVGKAIVINGGTSEDVSSFFLSDRNKRVDRETGEISYSLEVSHADGKKTILTIDRDGGLVGYYDAQNREIFLDEAAGLGGVDENNFKFNDDIKDWIEIWNNPENGDVLLTGGNSDDD